MNITNFRPISLLTSLSKILGKGIYTKLYQHINQNNVLATEQYGFRNNSTEKASYKLINEWLLALNNKLTDGGIFCDLEKAVNCIYHNILLSKYEFYGFRGRNNALLRSYLSDGCQRMLIDNSFSNTTTFTEWGKIKQCLVLGPLFFLLYINDLTNIIADLFKLILFADDMSIISANPSPSKFKEDINNVTGNLNNWFKVNSLSVTFDKTYCLHFMTKNSHEITIQVSCDNKQIKGIKNTIFLGLDIGSSLSWKDYIDLLIFKLCNQVFLSQDALRAIYFSYLIPSYHMA